MSLNDKIFKNNNYKFIITKNFLIKIKELII